MSLYSPTTMIPKGLLRVMGLPIAEIQLESIKSFGIKDTYVLTQYLENRDQLSLRFSDGQDRFGLNIEYSDPILDFYNNGSGDAILTNIEQKDLTGDSLVLPNDNLFEFNLDDILKQHRDTGAVVTMLSIPMKAKDTIRQYGLIDTDLENKVSRLVEKPKDENHIMKSMGYKTPEELDRAVVQVNTAGYIINNDALKEVAQKEWVKRGRRKSSGEFDMAGDLVHKLVEKGAPIHTYPIDDWGDFGTNSEYLKSTSRALQGAFPTISRILEERGYIHLENESWVHPDSYRRKNSKGKSLEQNIKEKTVSLGPHTFVGRHVTIENGANVTHSDIEKYNSIGKDTEVTDSYLSPYCIMGHHAYIRGSILGLEVLVDSSEKQRTVIEPESVIGPRVQIPHGSHIRNTTIYPGYTIDPKANSYRDETLRPTREEIEAFMQHYL
jgi:NDP-sugar pyrophosphorylase family protein